MVSAGINGFGRFALNLLATRYGRAVFHRLHQRRVARAIRHSSDHQDRYAGPRLPEMQDSITCRQHPGHSGTDRQDRAYRFDNRFR